MRALILIASALLVGSAFAEDKPEAPAASATPAAATPAAESKEPQNAKAAKADEKKSQFKPPPGYKVKIKEWDIVYCRKEAVLGSRFPQEICMTEAELKAYTQANDEMRRNKDQSSRICGGTGCD